MIPNTCFNLYFNNQVRCNFSFTENFLRMTFPNAWDLAEEEVEMSQVTLQEEQVKEQVREQVKEQVKEQVIKLLDVMENEMSVREIMKGLKLNGRRNFLQNNLQPAVALGLIEMTQPDSPNSPTQKYRLAEKGKTLKNNLKNE